MSSRRPMIAGNWKMNGTTEQGAALARELRNLCLDLPAADVAVFPPFLSIAPVLAGLQGTEVVVGGQDLHPEAGGAYTGNISGEMLRAAGCRWVHSEALCDPWRGGGVRRRGAHAIVHRSRSTYSMPRDQLCGTRSDKSQIS